MKDPDNHVLIGRVGKPHGIKGEVRIFAFSGDVTGLADCRKLLLSPQKKDADLREYDILRSRDQGKYVIVALSGVNSRDEAEQIRDSNVWLDRDDLPELAEDEFYWHDFEGSPVYTRLGSYLGKVSSLISSGPQDLLVIRSERGKEYMIPVCDEFVEGPDETDGRIIVSPPEGLLEINE